MSNKGDNILERMKLTKAGWKAEHLEKLYISFGLKKKEKRKHTFYRHPDHLDLSASVTRSSKELKAVYIDHALDLISKLKNR